MSYGVRIVLANGKEINDNTAALTYVNLYTLTGSGVISYPNLSGFTLSYAECPFGEYQDLTLHGISISYSLGYPVLTYTAAAYYPGTTQLLVFAT